MTNREHLANTSRARGMLTSVNPDAVMRELAGLQALARSLVHGDSDADDLIQETAVAAMLHPPTDDRPVRPWLAAVLRNRWKMDRRGRARRHAREQEHVREATQGESVPDAIDRARVLERLASALVALDEPLRVVVMRRYLDGQSAAEIARSLGVPAGTVRWRLKTGLERLRIELERTTPNWRRSLLPFAALKGAVLVKAKTTALSILLFLLLLGAAVVAVISLRSKPAPRAAQQPASASNATRPGIRVMSVPSTAGETPSHPDPLPGQGRVAAEPGTHEGGSISGRVINWSTGEGVANAEVTFTSAAGASTIRTRTDGGFELAPSSPGRFALATIVAPGFLPFAPELAHSPVRIVLAPKQEIRGLTWFLFPAVDYVGTVVDANGAPVAGARISMADSPGGEQTLERIVTEWTADAKGAFTFHAPDGAVLEATKGNKRGWAVLDGNVATTKQMKITIGDVPARDATIRGKTVDSTGAPLPDVLVTAVPESAPGTGETRAVAYATSAGDGSFVLERLDRESYTLVAELDDYAQVRKEQIAGGSRGVSLTLDEGLPLAGTVSDPEGKPVPAYTLLVTRREGLVRSVIAARSVVDPGGRFEVRVAKGDYELLISASGWAPSAPVTAAAGTTDAKIRLGAGGTLIGRVVDSATGAPLSYARVMREGAGGGASAQPANAGTVTRPDGTFELTGIPPGPFTISIGGHAYNPRLEGGLVAVEGGVLGPIRVPLTKIVDGEAPKMELVGIGVKLSPHGESLNVDLVVPEGGAAAAGIVVGDQIVAIDGMPVTALGIDGAVARIRGVASTTVAVSVRRGEQVTPLLVERKPFRL